jgi:hypothetical protein
MIRGKPHPCPSILRTSIVIEPKTDEARARTRPLPVTVDLHYATCVTIHPMSEVTRRYAVTEAQLRSKNSTIKRVIPQITAESGPINSSYVKNDRIEKLSKINGITGLIQLKPFCPWQASREFLVHNLIVNGSFCGVTRG